MNFTIQDFFKLGMKKHINQLIPNRNPQLNIGAGNHYIDGARSLDLPDWNADKDPIPALSETIKTIHAYHIFEHVKNPVKLIFECQRVLTLGGSLNIVVPYYNSNLFSSDLNHKHCFTENTWRLSFQSKYYNDNKLNWKFKINANFIMGVEERCLALFTQLVKE